MKEIIIKAKVPYRKHQKQIGNHLIDVVVTNDSVFRSVQMQKIGDRWTDTGCNWYSQKQMKAFEAEALKGTFGSVRRGIAKLIEYDDENLRGERYLITNIGAMI